MSTSGDGTEVSIPMSFQSSRSCSSFYTVLSLSLPSFPLETTTSKEKKERKRKGKGTNFIGKGDASHLEGVVFEVLVNQEVQ